MPEAGSWGGSRADGPVSRTKYHPDQTLSQSSPRNDHTNVSVCVGISLDPILLILEIAGTQTEA